MAELGYPIADAYTRAPFDLDEEHLPFATGAVCNVPAMALVLVLTFLLLVGGRMPALLRNIIVALKVGLIVLVIAFGLSHVDPENLTPFVPEATDLPGQFGWIGILKGAGVVFFAYIGFDAISAQGARSRRKRRARHHRRDPVVHCAVRADGADHHRPRPLHAPQRARSGVRRGAGSGPGPRMVGADRECRRRRWPRRPGARSVARRIVRGLSCRSATDFCFLCSARCCALRHALCRRHRHRPCRRGIAGFLPLAVLVELVSIGTLAAFIIVCIAVMVLRSTAPDVPRPFRTPLVPLIPLLGVGVCGAMMYVLPGDTWLRFAVWMFVGLVVYGFYGMKHARAPGITFAPGSRP